MAPIIGLTTYGRYEHKRRTKYFEQFFCSPTKYTDAVRRAGGIPILLPYGEQN